MNNKWIFKNGLAVDQSFTSFPFAFRAMYHVVRRDLERGRTLADITKKMVIVSPSKDVHGDPRKYNYADASAMAKSTGLLTADGTINGKEFRR